MNSKDLRAVEHIKRLTEIGVDCLQNRGADEIALLRGSNERKCIVWRLMMQWQGVNLIPNI